MWKSGREGVPKRGVQVTGTDHEKTPFDKRKIARYIDFSLLHHFCDFQDIEEHR